MLLFAMGTSAQAQSLLTHHLHEAVVSGQVQYLNGLPATQALRIDIVLPLRDQAAGLEKLLQKVTDPSSPSYRHFLTVPEFTARFGPSQKHYDAVVQYAKSHGLKVVGGSRDGLDVQLKGSVADIEAAFHVTIGVYRDPAENRTFYSPDREPTVDLPFPLWHVSGLDNYSIPRPALEHRALGATSDTTVTPATTTGSCPGNSYCGSDMRAAYYGGTALTGAGQSLGLLEYYGYNIADVNTYFTNTGQTNTVPVVGIPTDGTSVSCTYPSCDDTEQTLDITQAVSMAPGLAALNVYVGSSDTALLSSMSTHTTNGKLDAQLSSSWTWEPSDPGTDDPYFKKFAAQGQSYFQAAGDSGAYRSSSQYVFPADDANVTAVGGTDLATSGAGGSWVAETVWSDGGGGYFTPDAIPIPLWQQLAGVITGANEGSTTLRNAPDVAAEANFDFYVCANQNGCTANYWGGTSFAAPMWAGYMALANQQAVANGHSTVGFINPTIYPLGLGSGYDTDFHDITIGSNGYSAVTGYDLATGWGSPNTGLIDALAGTASGPDFTISALPGSQTVPPSGSTTYMVTIGALKGYTGTVTPSVTSALPTGVTASFSPTTVTGGSGTSTLSVSTTSATPAGSHVLTIQGTDGTLTHTTTVTLNVADFTISASPSSRSIAQGTSTSYTVTVGALGGFTSTVGLGVSGLPSGATASFSPSSVTGSGSSTLTVNAGTAGAGGPYSLTVTGTAGTGQTHNAPSVSLTITASDFTISASPSNPSTKQGQSTKSQIAIGALNGFTGSVGLSITSTLPAGLTATFNPTSISGSNKSNLTLTPNGTPAGTYTLTVTGTSGALSHSTNLMLTVSLGGNITVTARPTTVSVSRSRSPSGTTTITITSSSGFDGAVALSANGLPGGATAAFSPTSVNVGPNSPGTTTMTLKVSPTTNTGNSNIYVTGNSGGGGPQGQAKVTLQVGN